MPLKVDRMVASIVSSPSIVEESSMIAIDNTGSYPNSTVFSSFNKTGLISKPTGNLNVFTLKSQLEMLETTEDIYIVFLGTIFSDTTPSINNIKGSFNNVLSPFIPPFFTLNSTTFGYNAVVEDALSPGSTYLIDFADVSLLQIDVNEYLVLTIFYTTNALENFIANLTLEVEITSTSEVTFTGV